jgi:hypothetical protein
MEPNNLVAHQDFEPIIMDHPDVIESQNKQLENVLIEDDQVLAQPDGQPNKIEPVADQNIQVGIVLTPDFQSEHACILAQHVMQKSAKDTFSFSMKGTKPWKNIFKPADPLEPTVTFPAKWVEFFTIDCCHLKILVEQRDFNTDMWGLIQELDCSQPARNFIML